MSLHSNELHLDSGDDYQKKKKRYKTDFMQ